MQVKNTKSRDIILYTGKTAGCFIRSKNVIDMEGLLMNDIFDRNRGLAFDEKDNFFAERIASAAEKAFESAMDTSADIDAIKELTPDDGFRLKLETIKVAEDMSSQEKLEAISEAEDKLADDRERSAKLHIWLIAKKIGLAILLVGGSFAFAASPVGQKTIKGASRFLTL